MKKLTIVLAVTLALNFLAAVGGAAYLFSIGALSKEKVAGIKELMFPAATQAAEQKKDQPEASTQPTYKMEELLAKVSGRPAGEQVEFMQRTFDMQVAQLDRREQELRSMQGTIKTDREKLDALQKKLQTQQNLQEARAKAQAKEAEDKGFQDSLALYNSMQPKQVKDVFATLDDPTVMKYLRAMDPPRAAKIIKEFKTPVETERVQKLMEMIRAQQADVQG
jgi:hypothetical protein